VLKLSAKSNDKGRVEVSSL